MHSTNSNIDQLYHNLFVHDSPTPSGINALEDAPRRRNTHGTLETQPRRRRDVSAQTPLPHSRTRASFRWTIQEHRHSCGDRDRDRHQTSAIYSSRGFRYRSCLDPLTLVSIDFHPLRWAIARALLDDKYHTIIIAGIFTVRRRISWRVAFLCATLLTLRFWFLFQLLRHRIVTDVSLVRWKRWKDECRWNDFDD